MNTRKAIPITCLGRTGALSLVLVAVAVPLIAMAEASDWDTAAAEASLVLEEVVVTAQRRQQVLMDVPLAVTVLSGEELETRGALDLTYLSQTTPNTTIEIARGTNNALAAYIRGVGQQDHIAGLESGVGLYVDDVYFNRPQATLLDIYDVERIEVLRGPQGTLYGRNTVGGAIKYVTRRLDDEAALKLHGRAGNYQMLDAIVTASAPLGESLRVGGSFATFNHNGFGDNLYQPGVENYNKKVNAVRLSAEWLPRTNWFFRLAADWLQDDSDLRRGHRLLPGGHSGAPVLEDVFDTRAGLAVPIANAEASGVSGLVEWAATDWITFRGIFASREDETWKPTDLDGLPTVDADTSTWDRNTQKTGELQAVFSADRWSAVAGVFVLDASAATVLDTVLGTTGELIGRPGLSNQLQGYIHTSTWSVYADMDFSFTNQWSGSLGGRFTHDQRSSRIIRQTLVGGLSPFFGGTAEVVATTSDFDGSATFEKFTPRAAIRWQPGDRHNLYLSYSEGFKGGGFDPRGLTTRAPDFDGDGRVSAAEIHDFMKFDPEQVKSVELGWKWTLFDGRMTSRLAIFKGDYTDVQIPGSVTVDEDGDGFGDQYVGITTNAADADINGLEWEVQAIVGRNLGFPGAQLTLSWALGLIDAQFNEYIDEVGRDVADERGFANTPDWTAAVIAHYSIPVAWFGLSGDLALITELSARDDQIQFEIPNPLYDQKAYALWDLSLVWSDSAGHWQVGLHGKNLADKRYKVSGLDIELGREGNWTAFFGNPRQYWLDLQYRFH